jgi:uncharacterized damage-inducible protein DinB
MSNIRTQSFLQELNAEYRATRACLEKIPEGLFEYKPHPKSMNLGYLALLVAEIPLWISHMIVDGEIDLATFRHITPATNADLVAHFEENMQAARKALEETNDEQLGTLFLLKSNGQVLYSAPKIIDIGVTLNHWVHHRGQLTVYMRLNDIPVPSIYGPSADEKGFTPPS